MAMIYEEEGYAIRGAVFEVSKTLGTGFAEEVYQEALEMELAERGIPGFHLGLLVNFGSFPKADVQSYVFGVPET